MRGDEAKAGLLLHDLSPPLLTARSHKVLQELCAQRRQVLPVNSWVESSLAPSTTMHLALVECPQSRP